MSRIYKYIASYGNDGYTPNREFGDRDEAISSICAHKGWVAAVESPAFSTGDGEAVALYETQAECDADEDGAYAPRVEEVRVEVEDDDTADACADHEMDRERDERGSS